MADLIELRARLADVRDRIAHAAARAGRDPSTVKLIAVSKTLSADAVRAAVAEGQVDFGENKVQEAQTKREATRDLKIAWHLIGHLQSNKAKKAATEFDWIHSIDAPDLVRKVDAAASAAGRKLTLLAQVDLAGEATKFGAREDELVEPLLCPERFVELRPAAAALEQMRIGGLAGEHPGDRQIGAGLAHAFLATNLRARSLKSASRLATVRREMPSRRAVSTCSSPST